MLLLQHIVCRQEHRYTSIPHAQIHVYLHKYSYHKKPCGAALRFIFLGASVFGVQTHGLPFFGPTAGDRKEHESICMKEGGER